MWTTRKKKAGLKDFNFNSHMVIQKAKVWPDKLKAVIYCRVSSDWQVNDGFWLESQESVCREYCKNHNPEIEVVAVFYDGWVSWSKTDRDWFNDCIRFIAEQNKHEIVITHFVCRELSRISRPDLHDPSAAIRLEWRIKEHWVEIIDVMWWTKDETDEDLLLKHITYLFAWYDRKRIFKLCQNWKVARLKEWYRPFYNPPTWYIRKRFSKRDYIDEIDPENWPIMKEWLELFANDPNMWKRDLFRYFLDKKLDTHTGKSLWPTFVDKIFLLHKLYFYAWYCIYPERWVNELIEWKHEWLISLDTAEKIRKKIISNEKHNKPHKVDDEFILKWLITCKWCGRKFTWWYTRKPNWKLYPYYWCQKHWCSERVIISKEELEKNIHDMIKQIEIPENIMHLYDKVLESVYSYKEWNRKDEVNGIKKRIKDINEEKQRIEQYLIKWNGNVALHQKMEENRATLDEEEIILNWQIEHKELLKIDKSKRLKRIREFIKNPLVFWEFSDRNLRKLIVEVRFWDSLYYSKNWKLQTNENPTLYSILSDFSQINTPIYQGWDSNPHDREVTRFWV